MESAQGTSHVSQEVRAGPSDVRVASQGSPCELGREAGCWANTEHSPSARCCSQGCPRIHCQVLALSTGYR